MSVQGARSLYAIAFKVPLAVWLLAVLSISFRGDAFSGVDCVLLFVPAVSLLVLVSANPGFMSFRYLLPLLPLLFIGVSRSARLALEGSLLRRCLTLTIVSWFVVGSLAVYPHSLHYFNELAGGSANGHIVLESSQDWGQDLLLLQDWLEQHPNARPLYLACQVGFDPKSIGIDYQVPFRGANDKPEGTTPSGWYAISETALYGVSAIMMSETGSTPIHHRLKEFQSRKPHMRIGYSIFLYHITEEDSPSRQESSR